MALDTRTAMVALNVKLDAMAPLLNDGYIRIYESPQPALPENGVGGAVLLAELRFANPAFPAAVGGVLTANPITSDASADNSGTPSWFRAFKSDGATAVFDGSVGTSNANMIVNSLTFVAGAPVSISALTYTEPQQGA